MPWLISSTTLNGAFIKPCKEFKKIAVETDLSPPDWVVPSNTDICSSSRNCTRISNLQLLKDSSSASLTSPSGYTLAKLSWKFCEIFVTKASSAGNHADFASWTFASKVWLKMAKSGNLVSKSAISDSTLAYAVIEDSSATSIPCNSRRMVSILDASSSSVNSPASIYDLAKVERSALSSSDNVSLTCLFNSLIFAEVTSFNSLHSSSIEAHSSSNRLRLVSTPRARSWMHFLRFSCSNCEKVTVTHFRLISCNSVYTSRRALEYLIFDFNSSLISSLVSLLISA